MRALLMAGFAALLVQLACNPEAKRPPNLVLITLDTLRADRLGSYGYGENTSPTLDAIAARGVRFVDAIAQATTTPPSHASILTGLTPPRHGLRKLYGQRLPDANETLAEILQAEGYATAAFVSAVPLRHFVGLDQGFDVYDDEWGPGGEGAEEMPHDRDARATNARVRGWLDGIGDGPVFLWVHYFDPHYPYFPPTEFRDRYGVAKARRDFLPFPTNANPRARRAAIRRTPSAKAVAKMNALYDAEIAYMDAAIGELQTSLREAGVLPNAVVAFVADHGEQMGESGYYFGHWDVLDPTARVPMAISHPDGRFAGQTVEQSVATVDLLPTILAWLGVAGPGGTAIDGRDLTPLAAGTEADERVVYTEQFEYFPVRAVRSGEFLLRQKAPARAKVSSVPPILYRRDAGAEPRHATDQPEVRARLTRALEAAATPAQRYPTEKLEVPNEVRAQLRALGYTDEARGPED